MNEEEAPHRCRKCNREIWRIDKCCVHCFVEASKKRLKNTDKLLEKLKNLEKREK